MTWRHTLQFVLMFCLILSAAAAPAKDRRLERAVDAYLAPLLERDLISGSVLIARGDRVLLAKGYGLANREYDMPNTPDTKFRLGSISKQFTSMGIFLLVQDGALTPEDKLADFLPDYPRGDEITLHMLMSHTSGVPNYNNLPDYGTNHMLPFSIDEVIATFAGEALLFEPGADWAYSNSGYVLLAKVIEVVSERPFAEFLRERIFEPLEMTGSGVDVFTDILPLRATGHAFHEGGVCQAPYRDMPFTSGAGSLYSTVRDLRKWDRALADNTLLDAELQARMFEPVMRDYACGWFVREDFGRGLIEHGGAINGFLTQINRFPDEDLLVVSLFNYESTFWRRVNRGLSALALGEACEPALRRGPAEVDAATLARYAGDYELTPGYVMQLSVEDGRLLVKAPNQSAEATEPQSDTLFFIPESAALMQVDLLEDATIRGVRIQQGANTYPCRRLD